MTMLDELMNARRAMEPWRAHLDEATIRLTEHLDSEVPIVIVDLDEPLQLRTNPGEARYLIVVRKALYESLLTELRLNDRELAAWLLWNRSQPVTH